MLDTVGGRATSSSIVANETMWGQPCDWDVIPSPHMTHPTAFCCYEPNHRQIARTTLSQSSENEAEPRLLLVR